MSIWDTEFPMFMTPIPDAISEYFSSSLTTLLFLFLPTIDSGESSTLNLDELESATMLLVLVLVIMESSGPIPGAKNGRYPLRGLRLRVFFGVALLAGVVVVITSERLRVRPSATPTLFPLTFVLGLRYEGRLSATSMQPLAGCFSFPRFWLWDRSTRRGVGVGGESGTVA